ncbi:MAG: response regulator [Deltaproteobacteria bacterium]|nr:response regulator [Deltaproteobacteria bacterium]
MDSTRTILVVDEVPMFRELGALFLARSGRVLTAAGGAEALELAQREQPDVVLTDLFMPDMDGEALCRAIKDDPDLQETPVIVMISGDHGRDRARCVRAGAADVLIKPLSRVPLVEAVNRFLRQGTVRGLPRIALKAPVGLLAENEEHAGTVRNISRGGLFVETPWQVPMRTEVQLHFELPDTDTPVTPTAQAIWHQENPDRLTGRGVGMRFLSLDGRALRTLDDYIFERMRPASGAGRGGLLA